MEGIWNAGFDKIVPDGAAGNQTQLGIFFQDGAGAIKRITQAEGNQYALNPEEVERNLIGQEAPSKTIRGYSLTFDKDIVIAKGEENHEFFDAWKRQRPTGEHAKLKVWLVDFRLSEEGADHHKYYAEEYMMTCAVSSVDETEGKLSVSFSQAGDRSTGVMRRTDNSTSDDPSTFAYGFTPSKKIGITAITTNVDEIETGIGEEHWVKVSFSPLGCPYDFKAESSRDSICSVERRRQSVIVRGKANGEATVTITSTFDSTKRVEIDVTVGTGSGYGG